MMKRVLAVASMCCLSATMLSAAPAVNVRDVDNRVVDPFAVPASVKGVVFLFTSIDCPISNRYAPIVRQLNDTFGPKGVQFWLVYPNPFDTPDGIHKHLKAYSYDNGALLDPDHVLAKLANATVTPEAALFDRNGHELYHGRIDDRYVNLSVERPAPTRHDLEDALTAFVGGKAVPEGSAQPVGCFISDFVK